MFNRLGELQVFYDEKGDFTTSDAMFVCLLWKCSMSRYEMEGLSETVDLRYLLGVMNSNRPHRLSPLRSDLR